MEKLIAMLDNMDLSGIMPDIGKLIGKLDGWMRLLVLLGPLLLLAMGLGYLLVPTKEATYRRGYRTYFGMGSIRAWRYTQRLAGMVQGGLGLLLTVIMLLVSLNFGKLPALEMVEKAISCLLWQVGLFLLCRIGIAVTAMLLFDADGRPRKRQPKKSHT